MTRIAIIDSQVSGISGDMLLASLVDAGANRSKIMKGVLASQDFLKGSKINAADFVKTVSHGVRATEFQLNYEDGVSQRKGMDMYRSLASCCNSLDLEQRAKTFALESLKTIIAAEALIHGEDVNSVHLHEASSIDTFADLIGCATAIQDLNLFDHRIFSTKVAIGGGVMTFSHGIVPNPSNAILEIFKNKPFTLVGSSIDQEVTTPTGAAMLVNLTHETLNYYPSFIPEKIGYGTGQKKFTYIPNILRLTVGNSSLVSEANLDSIYLIETNVDDISGEIIGNIIEQLTEAGVKDITAFAGISKKNRPTHLLRIIVDQSQLHNILETLFRESGTMGARVQEVQRFVVPRSIITVPIIINHNHFNVHVKIAKDSRGKIINMKPEFDDIKTIAYTLGISAKTVMELALSEITYKVGRHSGVE